MSARPDSDVLGDNPLWFKDAIIYEIHIRAFSDSNGDGCGDFPGLIDKLDYLQDLGVTAIWLLPFYPSPLKDAGYDIADYEGINPAYGTLEDFQRVIREAHARGIRVITELVLNHTSADHAWFQRARRAPAGSPERDFYVWSDTPNRYTDARIIFKDFETSNWSWDPVANAYYWHRFYAHQPDLNFDNPVVHKALTEVVDFWLAMGVDGLRLDAVPYLYEREGTNCENLGETHAFLKKLRAHIDAKHKDKMLLAEANQWPEDAAAYFGNGDECHMNFHFPLMPRIYMAVQQEDRFPIVDILRQTPAIPESCQWATFLRNHDELTLEMVTDEDRDYMYRMYAEDPTARINLGIRHRLAPLVKSRDKIELMNALLFSLPGTPVLYYGDEIGMGDNIYLGDRDGVRTPMQWSADRNAGFSSANPQKLYLPVITDAEYHYESNNVQAQQGNSTSLLWWTKRLIALRKQHPVFGSGTIEFLHPDNAKVLAFVRAKGDDRVLVVANLSRFVQYAELDLAAYRDMKPVEMFGRTEFPVVGERPYFMTLAPHSFLWFSLEKAETQRVEISGDPPLLQARGAWRSLFAGRARTQLAAVLVQYIAGRRWFRSKARARKGGSIVEVIDVADGVVAFVQVDYVEGDPETYLVPLQWLAGPAALELEQKNRGAVIARVHIGPEGSEPILNPDGAVYDSAAAGGAAANALMDVIRKRATLSGEKGKIRVVSLGALDDVLGTEELTARTSEFEQTNTTVPFGNRALLKLYRQVEWGPCSELEIGLFLTEVAKTKAAPRVVAGLQYVGKDGVPATLAIVQEFIPNEGPAWELTLTSIARYFERVVTERHKLSPVMPAGSLLERSRKEPPPEMLELFGGYLTSARLLGRRTAEMHLAMATPTEDAAFKLEAFTGFYQQSIYQRAHSELVKTFEVLRKRVARLPESARDEIRKLTATEKQIDARLRRVTARKIEVGRIRVHGDLHLGQVLHTGDDFVLIDFEGEPARPLNERRYKRSPLRDVCGMLRSFQYAGETAVRSGALRPDDVPTLKPWVEAWTAWVSGAFVSSYFQTVGTAPFVPTPEVDRELMLDFYLLEKCIYEIGYELNNRPEWLQIPLRGLSELMEMT